MYLVASQVLDNVALHLRPHSSSQDLGWQCSKRGVHLPSLSVLRFFCHMLVAFVCVSFFVLVLSVPCVSLVLCVLLGVFLCLFCVGFCLPMYLFWYSDLLWFACSFFLLLYRFVFALL